jgi:hypothetical protein
MIFNLEVIKYLAVDTSVRVHFYNSACIFLGEIFKLSGFPLVFYTEMCNIPTTRTNVKIARKRSSVAMYIENI